MKYFYFFILLIFLSSCGISIQKQRYSRGYYIDIPNHVEAQKETEKPFIASLHSIHISEIKLSQSKATLNKRTFNFTEPASVAYHPTVAKRVSKKEVVKNKLEDEPEEIHGGGGLIFIGFLFHLGAAALIIFGFSSLGWIALVGGSLAFFFGILFVIQGIIGIKKGASHDHKKETNKEPDEEKTNRKEDVVYLKNGSVIRGEILEMIPNQTIKIQTLGGSVFVYSMSEVVKVTKEDKIK